MSPDLPLPPVVALPARGSLPRALLLVALAVLATDISLWDVTRVGLGLPIAFLVAGLLALMTVADLRQRQVAWGLIGLFLSALPAVEAVKPASVIVLLAGGTWFAGCLIAAAGHGKAILAALVFPVLASTQWFLDLIGTVERTATIASRPAAQVAWRDWLVPVGLGAVFIWLLSSANPLLQVGRLHWPDGLTELRIIFWLLIAAIVWPVLRTGPMAGRLARWPALPTASLSLTILSERSVLRSLILFNLIFAVQTLSDLTFLWGGAALPDGMTYATYAHRGAYPLVATALLAGAFALIAQPHLAGRAMRTLLVLWVAQNLGLVISSLLRLDLYVQTYGLTHLRVAAFVWMGLVAGGLALMLWQLSRRLPVLWTIRWSALLGVATIWLTSFANIDGLIARVNLNGDQPWKDVAYVCALGPGAIPALVDSRAATGRNACAGLTQPRLTPPNDWREWGFRNHRILLSLTEAQGDTE